MKAVLYVSKARLSPADASGETSRIVAGARERHATDRITGMLIFTGAHFAQLLEGPEEAIDTLMASIRRDQRHALLWEQEQPIAERSFGSWSLGYAGESTYVDRLVRSLLATAPFMDLEKAHAELRKLMLLLAHQSVGLAHPA